MIWLIFSLCTTTFAEQGSTLTRADPILIVAQSKTKQACRIKTEALRAEYATCHFYCVESTE